jgi:hypothetical protein
MRTAASARAKPCRHENFKAVLKIEQPFRSRPEPHHRVERRQQRRGQLQALVQSGEVSVSGPHRSLRTQQTCAIIIRNPHPPCDVPHSCSGRLPSFFCPPGARSTLKQRRAIPSCSSAVWTEGPLGRIWFPPVTGLKVLSWVSPLSPGPSARNHRPRRRSRHRFCHPSAQALRSLQSRSVSKAKTAR